MPSCLLTGVHHLNTWSFKGDNHHEDTVFYFSLTSSRIDSIRASQHPNAFNIWLLMINVKSDPGFIKKAQTPAYFILNGFPERQNQAFNQFILFQYCG
jgi:hypothetical protein